MNKSMLIISEIIRFHRKKAGLTQIELAKLAGIGKTAVFDLEKGKITVQLSTLLAVFHILNIQFSLNSSIMYLFNRGEKEKG